MIWIWVKESLRPPIIIFDSCADSENKPTSRHIDASCAGQAQHMGFTQMTCVSSSSKTKQTDYVTKSKIHILITANSLAYVQLFCREGSDSHSGGVGLRHSKHITNIQRGDTEASAHSAHSAIWWCHKWICAWKNHFMPLWSEGTYSVITQQWLRCAQQLLTVPKSMSRRAALAPSTRMFFGGPWSASYM